MCNPIHFIHLAMYWIVIMVVTRSGYPSGKWIPIFNRIPAQRMLLFVFQIDILKNIVKIIHIRHGGQYHSKWCDVVFGWSLRRIGYWLLAIGWFLRRIGFWLTDCHRWENDLPQSERFVISRTQEFRSWVRRFVFVHNPHFEFSPQVNFGDLPVGFLRLWHADKLEGELPIIANICIIKHNN